MKEKRYFCDYYDNFFDFLDKLSSRTLGIFFIVIALLGFTISYIVILNTKEYEFAEYSAERYEYLDEIADTVIQPGIGINLAGLPDDVVEYEIKSEDDEIVFYYRLDNNSFLAPSASMTVKLSNNCNIISKKPSIASEKEYIYILNTSVFLISFGFSIILVGGIIFIYELIFLLLRFLKYIKSTIFHK